MQYAEKNFRVWTFQTRFRPENFQLLAQSLILYLAVVIHGQQKKSEWPQRQGKITEVKK
jgi:hypothetical protein